MRPWSLVLRVPSSEGLLYYKEPVAFHAHEARLLEVLAQRRPALVTEVLFSDEQGRMLMRDAGEQLEHILARDLDLRYWEQALPLYAELQIEAAADADELVAAGAFERRSSLLPAVYERLVAERPEGASEEEHRRLLALVPEVERFCARPSPVPETINHDDLTFTSIFLRGGACRFLDWGDACVSHPFFTLTVTLRVIELRHELLPGSAEVRRVRDAYLEPFTCLAPLAELGAEADEARRFGQICRAALRAEADWEHEAETVAWLLRLLLDPEAWRAWS